VPEPVVTVESTEPQTVNGDDQDVIRPSKSDLQGISINITGFAEYDDLTEDPPFLGQSTDSSMKHDSHTPTPIEQEKKVGELTRPPTLSLVKALSAVGSSDAYRHMFDVLFLREHYHNLQCIGAIGSRKSYKTPRNLTPRNLHKTHSP
jgi:hypothetical protein